MKAMENWQPDDLPRLLLRKWGKEEWFGNLLLNPLMRTPVIEKSDILVDHPSGMTLTEDQDMVQAFAANCTEETLTQCIGFRGLERGVQQFGVNTGDGAFKQHAVLMVIVANQITRPDPEARCLSDLLSDPSISWSTCDGEVNHAA